MNVETVILTCDRPVHTLGRTIKSLQRAGFAMPRVLDGTPPDGPSRAGHRIATWSIWLWFLNESRADWLLVVEDDVVFCRGLAAYLERCLALAEWGDVDRLGLVSLFTPEAYVRPLTPGQRRMWQEQAREFYLSGAQAWLYPLPAVAQFPKTIDAMRDEGLGEGWAGDNWAGALCHRLGLMTLYHTPSLAEHVAEGPGKSATGYGVTSTSHAIDFVGEDFDAMRLLR